MQRFQYIARDADGARQTGTGEAITAVLMANQLSGRGLTPISIHLVKEKTPTKFKLPSIKFNNVFEGFNQNTKVKEETVTLAMRELAALLKAGIPILRALRLVSDTTESAGMRNALENISADLDGGRDLGGAMERERVKSGVFHPYDVAMVQVGEQTGQLDASLLALYRHREFMHATREQIKSALRYPLFVILTCVAALIVINLFVLPSFEKVFLGLRTELPYLTRFLLGMSRTFVSSWPVLVVIGFAATFGVRAWLATPMGKLNWDAAKFKIPVVGTLVYRSVMARFASSLATSLRAGLSITQALQVTAQTLENVHASKALKQMRAGVERGESLTRVSTAAKLFPPALLQMIAIGEESGTLDELLAEIAVHYHTEVEYGVKRLSSKIEPMLIILLGAGVLILALGVFLPMWELGRASIK